MAPIDKKRKSGPTNESFVRSKKGITTEARPSKRQRKDNDANEERSAHKATTNSRLSKAGDEDEAFPRGGASVLTPLEHKQIQIDATRDVLFEQEETKSSGKVDDERDVSVKKKPKSRSKSKTTSKASEPEPDIIKIEGLSYKVGIGRRCFMQKLIGNSV